MAREGETKVGLIITVGAQAEQVHFAFSNLKPTCVAFLGTETEQCRQQIDDVVQRHNIPATRFKPYLVPDAPSSAGQLAAHCMEALHWLRDHCGVPAERIKVDVTGGRKWMSAAAIMVAAHLGLELVYVDVSFVNGKPEPSTMRHVGLGDVYDRLNLPAWADAVRHYNYYEYQAAADTFAGIRSCDLVVQTLAHILRELSLAADRLDRFQGTGEELGDRFEAIADRLRTVVESRSEFHALSSLAEALERLAENLMRMGRPQKVDKWFAPLFLLSADRHLDRGLPEAAVLLYYRVLKLAEQVWLQEGWNFDTSRPDWDRLPSEVVSEFRQRYPDAEQVSLVQGYVLLHMLGHPEAASLGHMHKGCWRPDFEGALEVRNLMVWEHGFRPVTREAADKLRKWAVQVAEKLTGMTEEDMATNFGVPAIPDMPLWSGVGGRGR